MDPHRNGLPQPQGILKPARSARRWPLILLAFLVLILCVYGMAFFLSSLFREPAVKSIDEIDAANVERLALFIIRRPDEGPDIGSPSDPWIVPPAEVEAVLAPLRNARAISADRGVWLGRMTIHFKDGRKVEVFLHVTGDGQGSNPPHLRYKIEEFQYEIGPVGPFLQQISAADDRAKGRR